MSRYREVVSILTAALLLAAAALPAMAGEIHVNQDHPNCNNNPVDPYAEGVVFCRIQAAIERAVDGDTIVIWHTTEPYDCDEEVSQQDPSKPPRIAIPEGLCITLTAGDIQDMPILTDTRQRDHCDEGNCAKGLRNMVVHGAVSDDGSTQTISYLHFRRHEEFLPDERDLINHPLDYPPPRCAVFVTGPTVIDNCIFEGYDLYTDEEICAEYYCEEDPPPPPHPPLPFCLRTQTVTETALVIGCVSNSSNETPVLAINCEFFGNGRGVGIGEMEAVIQNNYFHDNVIGLNPGFGSTSQILSNWITHNEIGIELQSYGGPQFWVNYAQIANNTILMNTDGVSIKYESPHWHLAPTLRDNLIVWNSGCGVRCENPEGIHLGLSHNDVWDNAGGDYLNCGPGIAALSADPDFVDLAPWQMWLSPESPCIDRGSQTLDPGVTVAEGPPDTGFMDIGVHSTDPPLSPSDGCLVCPPGDPDKRCKYRSIQAAINAEPFQSTIRVRDGAYREFVAISAAKASRVVAETGDEDDSRPRIIRPVTSGAVSTVLLESGLLQGFSVLASPPSLQKEAIRLSGTTSAAPPRVVDCLVSDHGWGVRILPAANQTNGFVAPTVSHCEIRNNVVGVWSAGTYHVIEYNDIHNNSSAGVLLSDGSLARVFSNQIWENGQDAQASRAGIRIEGAATTSRPEIMGNTLYGNGLVGIDLVWEKPDKPLCPVIRENAICAHPSFGIRFSQDNHDTGGFFPTIRYNWFSDNNPGCPRGPLPCENAQHQEWCCDINCDSYTCDDNHQMAVWVYTGFALGDPMMVDPDDGDFRLDPGSPLIDAGSLNLDPGAVVEGGGPDEGRLDIGYHRIP